MKILVRLALALALVAVGLALGALLFREVPAPTSAAAPAGELWTCSMHPQVLQSKPGVCPICFMKLVPVRKGGDAPGSVTIDPALTQTLGLRTAPVAEGPLVLAVRTVGLFREAEPLRHDVALKISGWIVKLHADTEGQRLRKGDPLFDLYSPDLLVAQTELLAAHRALKQAGDALRPEAERTLATAKERLRLWDVPEETLDEILAEGKARSALTFRSPAEGYVMDKDVVQGAAVEASRRLLRIVDLSRLWLDARLYEPQLPHVAVGRKATARVGALPGRDFEGELIFVSPRVDAETRTAVARLSFPNPELILKPGMYAVVELEVPVSDRAIRVPREAVIDSGRRQVAFVAKEKGRFEARDVRMGLENGKGDVQILSGLAAGETVVVSGQFLLDAESRMREAIRKMSPSSPAPPAPPAGLAAVVRAYLALADSLAADRAVEAPAVDLLLAEAKKAGAAGLAEAVEHLCCVPIKDQRARFKRVSEAIIALTRMSPDAKGLYVIRCPVADALWLQASDQIRNPYFGAAMHACGEVVKP